MYQRARGTWDAMQACLPESISGLTGRGLTHRRAVNNGWSGLEAQHLGVRLAASWGLRAGREPGPPAPSSRPFHSSSQALAGPLSLG